MASNIPTLKAPPPVIGLPEWTANPTRRGLADITGTLFRRAGSPETRAEAAPPPERLSLPHLIKIGSPTCQSRFLIRPCKFVNLSFEKLARPSSKTSLLARTCGNAVRRLKVGTVMVREHKGTLHEVMVV